MSFFDDVREPPIIASDVRRHLRVLERRMAFLATRRAGAWPSRYDHQERTALSYACQLLRRTLRRSEERR